MILLDSDVVVDLLRGHPPALSWLRMASDGDALAVTGFTALECIQGCRNRAELKAFDALMREVDILWLSAAGCDEALERFRQERLSSGASVMDVLIAQTALEFNTPLHTFNIKHYRHMRGLELRQPYVR